MERVFVDTSAWYALLNARDVRHERALQLLDETYRLVTTNYVIDETITLTLIRAGYRQAVSVGDMLWSGKASEIVRITEEDEQAAWRMFKQFDDKQFSFTDCTSFVVMQRMGITLAFTFDDDFARTGLFVCLP